MSIKRYIRLKELTPSSEKHHTPTLEQVECADASLIVEPYLCRSDADGYMVNGNGDRTGLRSLIFMGDSFVESMYSQETDRFVSRVERSLELNGERFRCLNAGYSGSTSLQILNSMINKVFPTVGPGATIILHVPHSDRDNIYEAGSYWNSSPRGASVLPPSGTISAELPVGPEAAQAVLRVFISAARHLGLNLILATTPFRRGDFNSDAPLRRIYRRNAERYIAGLQRRVDLCEAVRSVARDTKRLPFIDGEHALAGHPAYFQDELHLNRNGQEAYAGFLVRALAEHL